LIALTLVLTASQARGNVVSLEALLNGASISTGDVSYENFRNFSGPTYPLGYGTAVNPNGVMVSTASGGLEFTGPNGTPLASTLGQVPIGAMFTFDVRTLGPGPGNISEAGVEMTGEVAFVGLQEPALSAVLASTGTTPPFQLVSQSGQSTGPNPVVSSTRFQTASLVTVTLQFDAIGVTIHGFNSTASIDQVGVTFVPEPGLPVLFGTMAVLGLMWRWRSRSSPASKQQRD
jgi:hypothetical protein